jgi:hypothetical protein
MATGTLFNLISELRESSDKPDVSEEHLWYAIRGALSPQLLVSNLAEALRIPEARTEDLLIANGFGDLVAQRRLAAANLNRSLAESIEYTIAEAGSTESPFEWLFSIGFSPSLSKPIAIAPALGQNAMLIVDQITQSANDDPFAALYRKGVPKYCERFLATDAKLIDDLLAKRFPDARPRYVVTTGIGADEQFCHLMARLNNVNPNRTSTWIIIDSPRYLRELPSNADVTNTMFMEFSRSGKTEETVKTHEYTTREAARIVFANSGPLRDLGLRDGNLVLSLPDEIAGRFGRNVSPILLSPMYVVGMDVARFWDLIENAIDQFDLSSRSSLPLQIAQFIYLYQQKNGINHIYLGCNDDVLAASADELLQFWNEGVNKGANDISMSRYFGLLRDSHANLEGILANHRTKLGIFLLRDHRHPVTLPPMTFRRIDPVNPDHLGLCYGDEETVLAEANYQRFADLMPVIKILVHGDITVNHAAVLGQLWADLTFCYSRMVNVDPGSNPEVKFVRDRSARLLAEAAAERLRSGHAC